jgi:hypothetical protein
METQNKDLEYYRKNAEEDYLTTPISVLRYISEMEAALRQPPVVGRSEQLKAFNDWFQQNGQLYEWGIDDSVIDDYLKSL